MERKSFGEFTLLDLICQDAGQLWRALDHAHDGREVALKIFDPHTAARFIQSEIYALRILDHECVSRLLAEGSFEGTSFIVFEPFEGSFLRGALTDNPQGLSLDGAVPVFKDILHALAYVHGKHVIHCNLKPDNILISPRSRAKLTDFSNARMKAVTISSFSDVDTHTENLVGTVNYMSPEQWLGGDHADARSDLYSFGILLFEVLTGRLPFIGDSIGDLAIAHTNTEPPSLTSVRPLLPENLEAVYQRLLAKNGDDRYQSAEEVAAEIDRVLLNATMTPTLILKPVFCPYCQHRLNDDNASQRNCNSCGKSWHGKTCLQCQACNEYTPGDGTYCEFCGYQRTRISHTTIRVERDSDEVIAHEPSVSSEYSMIPSMHWSAIATQAVFGGVPPPLPTELEDAPRLSSPSAVWSPSLIGSPRVERQMSDDEVAFADSVPLTHSTILTPEMKLLGRYRIISRLGMGGFANVYLAYDEWLDEKIAIKIPYHDESAVISKTFQSLLKPWKFLSDKDPSRVVKLFHAEHVQARAVNAFCIFMEYMSGGSLAEMVIKEWSGRPRNPDELAKLMRLFLQSCRAVRFLHAHNALHRDIKPANMLLDAEHTICKLSDFELVDYRKDGVFTQTLLGGTPSYMAPECANFKDFSEASDIFALGVTLYQLLSGRLPFQGGYDKHREAPQELTKLNPLVSQELQQVVMRCLDFKPEHRPQGVDDLIADLAYIGVSDEETNAAPVNLAHLLLTHLDDDDKDYLTKILTEDQGFHSSSKKAQRWQSDLIQEYCYTASPHDVLTNNFTSRQLAIIADKIGLKNAVEKAREEVIADILEAMGFLSGPQKIPGIQTTRTFLESQLMGLTHATNSDECSGMALSGLTAVERTVDWLVRFYGQLFYGSGFTTFLSRQANGKPWNRITFGEKAGALRLLCSKRPTLPMPHRLQEVFEWPIISHTPLDQLDRLVKRRNELAHTTERGVFYDAQRSARQILSVAVDLVTELANNRFIPRIVQIISRQDDVYGRHFYLGRDDRDHSERIFTPLPLIVGQLYLFYPLTNPVCINPLIYPYDASKQGEVSVGKTVSSRKNTRRNEEPTQ